MNMFMRKWGEHVIRSQQYAAGLCLTAAFLSFFDVPIGWLSSMVIALVTLQKGARQGIIILSWAMLPAVAMLYLGHVAVFTNVVFLHYLLIWTFAVLLRQSTSWTLLLQFSACLGILGVIFVYFFMPEMTANLAHQLLAVAKLCKEKDLAIFKTADIDRAMQYASQLATGLLAILIVMSNLFVLFLARWWQSLLFSQVSIQAECHRLRMHYLSSLVALALVLGLYFNVLLFVNILLIASVPFIFCGLSLMHAYTSPKKNGHVMLIVFYGLFLCLSPYVVAFLSLVGWFDSFLNFRKKVM